MSVAGIILAVVVGVVLVAVAAIWFYRRYEERMWRKVGQETVNRVQAEARADKAEAIKIEEAKTPDQDLETWKNNFGRKP